MPDDAPPAISRALRAHLAEHNLRVALFTLLTLLAAIALWCLLYAAMHWLALLAATIVRGTETHVPRFIDEVFWTSAAALLSLAWIDRQWRPDDRARDHKSVAEVAWEIFLVIPRVTFAIGGTLSAWQYLSRFELATAAELVSRLSQERRLPLHSLPLEIPDEKLRQKIVFTLQLLQIVDLRREDRVLWLALNPLRPTSLQPKRSRDAAIR